MTEEIPQLHKALWSEDMAAIRQVASINSASELDHVSFFLLFSFLSFFSLFFLSFSLFLFSLNFGLIDSVRVFFSFFSSFFDFFHLATQKEKETTN